jgi:hypothetical protein
MTNLNRKILDYIQAILFFPVMGFFVILVMFFIDNLFKFRMLSKYYSFRYPISGTIFSVVLFIYVYIFVSICNKKIKQRGEH